MGKTCYRLSAAKKGWKRWNRDLIIGKISTPGEMAK